MTSSGTSGASASSSGSSARSATSSRFTRPCWRDSIRSRVSKWEMDAGQLRRNQLAKRYPSHAFKGPEAFLGVADASVSRRADL